MKKNSKHLWIMALILLTCTTFPAFQVMAVETAAELKSSYFLPELGKTYIYQHQSGDQVENVKSMWEQGAAGIYTNTLVYNHGAVNFTKYVLDNNEVVQIDSGFSIPQSEWSNEPVIMGKNVVFKSVTPGNGWVNNYQTKDGWETVCGHQSNYIFKGFENIVLMGEEMQAARFNSCQGQTIVSEAPLGAEWASVPYTATCDEWYVDGIGLVKSSTVTTTPDTEAPYAVTNTLVDIVDVPGISPNKAIEMICQHIGKTNQENVYVYQEPSQNGLYVINVTVPQGYPKGHFCGNYYVNPFTGAISR
jgi:hypothetical protein